ncbi:MAG: T9SS type A sorting domain-containing protein, partial [Bacteroidales bacterium]|nr:T9SS type A sorting domain-containing protein [Bacteroidales bacterium]
ELNRVTETGCLQSDGSITQLTIGAQPNSQTRFNWFHNTVKSGARFDAPVPPVVWGHGGTMRRNVVWETNIGLMQKGEYHFCYHNSVFHCEQNGIVILDDASEGGGGNMGTITRNNFSDKLSGHRSDYMKVPGTADHNWNGYMTGSDFRDQVYDYSNHDFRPRWNSSLVDAGIPIEGSGESYLGTAPDLGAYEFGDSVYWIAGRQMEWASTPVPVQNGNTRYEFVDLMWLEGYRSLSSDVYFGTAEAAVGAADRGSSEFMGNQTNNIFNPGALLANQTYYWRIDALREGGPVQGELWSFTAGVNANPPVHTATFRVLGSKDGEVFPLEGALTRLGERKTETGADGMATITMIPEGLYGYHISRNGYLGISDSLYISSDTLLQDTLEHTTYNITFLLKDADGEEPIEGGVILFNDQELITDTLGKVSLYDIEYAWYQLSVFAPGFHPLEPRMVEILSDTVLELTMLREYLQVSVRIVNRFTQSPVYRAQISYGDQLTLTNHSGVATLDRIPVGCWVYRIEHGDYFSRVDSVMILQDTVLEIALTSKLASIQFEINDPSGPLEGAIVVLDEILTLVSDGEGTVKFLNQLAREQHRYSISREGYRSVSDTFLLEIDTVVSIVLHKPAGIADPAFPGLSVYPNPAEDVIFVKGLNNLPAEIRLMNLEGEEFLLKKGYTQEGKLELSNISEGFYLLQIRTPTGVTSRKVVVVK